MALSLQRATTAALEQAGLMGPDLSDDARLRLRIVFSDGFSMIFKPRKRFYGPGPLDYEAQMVLDMDLTDAALVDEVLFSVRERNLEEILGIIDRDSYKRLCLIYLDTYDWEERAAEDQRFDRAPTVGKQLEAWSGSLMSNGGSGITIRPGLEIEQILVARVAK